ncbi:MAG: RNA polymerase factor sigma-32 [Rickettsiaceae bacterium]|nr:RNA polymerase factor sigma-32 [Rickettsiaceae bacterium]
MGELTKVTNLPSLDNVASRDILSTYIRQISSIPSLTEEEEFLMAKAYLEERDLDAAHKLVTSHLKLVVKIALKYRNYGLPVLELISEGNIGLMHAVKKFKPDLGYRLSTYAMWWIKASIQEYVLKSWSLVKIGTTSAQKKLFFSLNKLKNKIRNEKSREINESDYIEISRHLGLTLAEVKEMDSRLSFGDLSLNTLSSFNKEDNSSELIDFVPEHRPSQELIVISREERDIKQKILEDALNTLSERELYVIQERRLKETQATLDELSNKLLISKERVRQIENKAFEKMQIFMRKSWNSIAQG